MVSLILTPEPGLMLTALAIEGMVGWPKALDRWIQHPVVWIGRLCDVGTRLLNRQAWSHRVRYLSGMLVTLIIITITSVSAILLSTLLPNTVWGFIGEALVASSLLASRSLHCHVAAVAQPLALGNINNARQAVAHIVGRDPDLLDRPGIARAALESLAENTSDGIIAPVFWGLLFGLPGIAVYKAINTLDSMIGHRSNEFLAFGGFAARLDDVANLIPARLTGFIFVLVSLKPRALHTMLRNAHRHRSPNAGWPEAAMAGALNIRLSGPRRYGNQTSQEPWLNEHAPDPCPVSIERGLLLYRRAILLCCAGLCLATIGVTIGQ
ncbi:MAG: adenosylcobinamide-phosphate synthase CbiB [Pseudomonadota bacterium]